MQTAGANRIFNVSQYYDIWELNSQISYGILRFMIDRDIQTELTKSRKEYPVVCVTGPRQSGKTTLARALAASLGCSFRRIQFTPDLLPSDVTGLSWFNQKAQEFEFRAGPVISQVVLADEINRATPRTQSALLEAMQERQVTVDGVTHLLPRPFLVMATQNPIEQEGTYPLPEAQIDRFMLKVVIGYPDKKEEKMIIRQNIGKETFKTSPIIKTEDILRARAIARAD